MKDFLNEETPSVTRLAFTPLAASALIFWLGAASAYSSGRFLSSSESFGIAVVCLIASVLLLFCACRIDGSKAVAFSIFAKELAVSYQVMLVCSAAFSAGLLTGFAGAYTFHVENDKAPGAAEDYVFCLQEDLIPRDEEYEVLAECQGAGESSPCLVLLTFDSDPGVLFNGECVASRTSLKSCSLDSDYSWSKGAPYEADIYSFKRVQETGIVSIILELRRDAVGLFETHANEQSGVLQALVCGYRGGIELSGEYEDYKLVGLAHIIAVSGSHLAIVANLVYSISMRLSLPARIRVPAVIGCIAAYFFFSGCSISALRSVVMVAISTCSLMAGRRGSALNALSICIVAFIALDPKTAVSVSFILSACSTLGIIVFAPLLISLMPIRHRGVRTFIVEPVALTLASGLTTQLYSAALFSQLSLISVFANIVAAPLFSIGCICGLAAVLASIVIPPLAPFALLVASLSVMPMQFCCSALAKVPYAAVPFHGSTLIMLAISALLCTLLYLAWPSRPTLVKCFAVFAVLVFALACARFVNVNLHDELVMFDVGQGDSFVIRSQGASLMIDTGNRATSLKQALSRNGVYHLDGVLITHPDADHCGAVLDLAEVVSIDAIYIFDDMRNCTCSNCNNLLNAISELHGNPEVVYLSYADQITIGTFSARVIWPETYTSQGANEDSLSLFVQHTDSDFSILLVGDAENEQLEAMRLAQGIDTVDVYKVGHHGSAGAISSEQAAELSPSVSLISVGEGNWYGHPNASVISALRDAGSFVLRTDETGDAVLRFTEDEIRIKP